MRFQILISIVFLVVLTSVLAVSFNAGPTITYSGSNVTTTDTFYCSFTPSGVGSLNANITWFINGSEWAYGVESMAVVNGVADTSTVVLAANTTKEDVWICQVTLYNGSLVNATNSSSLEVQNTPPDIDDMTPLTVYEDTTYQLTFTATDDDGDSLTWYSLDLDRGSYSNNELFIILTNGSATISETDEDLVGNHTMQITVYDEIDTGSVRSFELELVAVNDAPVITGGLSYSCNESLVCSGAVIATDEDNSSGELTFTFNESFINASSDGTFTFVPTYAQAVIGNHSIQVNVTDGNSTVTDTLTLNISTQNHEPNVSYVNVSGTQNDTSFLFEFNVTDTLDVADVFNFTVSSTCGQSPWAMLNITNGSGGTVATGRINTSLDNNSYVVCRNVNITVHETNSATGTPRATYVYPIFFNITNINDAPTLHELSYVNSQYNMSNLTAALGLSFNFTVNASDVDQNTYQGDNLTYSLLNVPTFANGSDMFAINNLTGLVYSVQSSMNASYSGTNEFTVRVTDSLTPNYYDERNLTVVVALNYGPVILAINSSDCSENFTCQKNLSASDFEGGVVSLTLNSLSFTNGLNTTNSSYTATQIGTVLGINTSAYTQANNITTYALSFTPDDANIGNYSLNMTFTDVVGNTNTTVLNFSVLNTPEAPGFDNDSDSSVLTAITFDRIVETVPFYQLFYIVDEDITYSGDTVTLSYVFNGAQPAGFSFVQLSNTTFSVNYTSNNAQSGNYSVNLTLNDSFGLTQTQTVTFRIYDTSEFPVISAVQPWYNTSTNATNSSSKLDIAAGDNLTTVYFAENDSIVFNITAYDDDNASMTVVWYLNGTQVQSSNYGTTHAYSKTFNFFENGTHNVTVRVSDIGYDEYTWIVNVSNTNRPPQYVNPARNFTGASAIQSSSSALFSYFFFLNADGNIVFYDPDDDVNSNGEIDFESGERNNLTFSINTSGSCDELGNFVFSGVDDNLTITLLDSGTCTTNFVATDYYGENVSSNYVTIQFIKTESSSSDSSSSSSRTRTVTETVTIPVEDPVDVPEQFKILYPGITVIYENGSVVVPIKVINTWDDPLVGITLGVNDSHLNLSYDFSLEYIPELAVDASVNLNLTLLDYRRDSPFSFNLTAFVGSLQFQDYETIHINALEKGQEDLEAIKSRIGFARDLLTDNPECGELLSVLEDAEANPEQANFEIINNVINGCKYLISDRENRNDALPKSFSGKLSVYGKTIVNYNVLFTILGVLFGVAIIVGVVMRLTMKKI